MSRIFINYRRQDSEGYTGRLYDHLVEHFKPGDIFMDIANIDPGVDFVQALEDAVAACDVCIAVIGPNWGTITDENGERRIDQWNDFVRIEIASAINQGKLLIPVLVGRARMPHPADLPDDIQALTRRNAIELTQKNFRHDVAQLVDSIKDRIPSHPTFKAPSNPEILAEKREKLKQLRIKLTGATESPLFEYRNENRFFPVLGEGNPDANIMFIGESPGKHEAEQGKPFVGPSGEIFDEMLENVGLKRDQVYITNVVLDRPPENRSPKQDEIEFYEPFVDELIDIIRPKLIVTLGRWAMEYLLKRLDVPEKRGKISQQHGKLIKAHLPHGEVHVMPMYHPAVILYRPSEKATIHSDFEKLTLFV